MESGRPAQGHSPSDPHHNYLLDLDRTVPVYNTGQRPPVDDNHLLERYDIDDSDQPQARPSVSYDEFVGGTGAPGNSNAHTTRTSQADSNYSRPYLDPGTRTYSQTSDLNNYSRYSDVDDFPEDNHSNPRYFDGGGASDENIPGGSVNVIRGGRARDRNSLLSLGGGIMGKAKNMLGMGPKYSEMDLPLTEGGSRSARTDATGTDEGPTPRQSKFSKDNFKFGIGRRKVDPSTLGPRMIQLNNAPVNSANKWVDNHVSTAKYNVATFIPKFLYEQFSKYANLFFLFTAVLQQIPNISPTNRYTTIVPLAIVLLVSAIKELVEDFKRKSSDQSLNHSRARVLRGSNFEDTKWVNIAVGDIIRVESEEPFPADLVLLASSEPEGLCYIETANLDGETNLKIKQAIPETAHLVSPAELGRLTGRVRSEQPNSSLYTYEATLTMQAGGGEKELPLAPDQLLLRGATLRNTPWIHGVVVFTGHETKLMRNATATPIKRTDVERMLNKQILMLVGILLVLSCVSSVGDLIVRSTARTKLAYLYYGSFNAAAQFFSDIFTYWVLYSNLVPISLFVTIEMVKYCSALLINSDLDMYYAETDTPAICRTSSLVEELGQIEYV
jgi:phospholipid-transporting ATPase